MDKKKTLSQILLDKLLPIYQDSLDKFTESSMKFFGDYADDISKKITIQTEDGSSLLTETKASDLMGMYNEEQSKDIKVSVEEETDKVIVSLLKVKDEQLENFDSILESQEELADQNQATQEGIESTSEQSSQIVEGLGKTEQSAIVRQGKLRDNIASDTRSSVADSRNGLLKFIKRSRSNCFSISLQRPDIRSY